MLAGAGADSGVRHLTIRGRTCGQFFPHRETGNEGPDHPALSVGSDTHPASGEAAIPQNCAVSVARSARRPNLDFRRENLVRDAVWSERCSGAIFPAFREIFREIGRSTPPSDGGEPPLAGAYGDFSVSKAGNFSAANRERRGDKP